MVARPPSLALGLLLLAAALAGCASASDGTASAYVKDAAPAGFREVHLVITGVSIHQSSDGNSSAGWTQVFSGAGTDVNLMNASGAKAAFLGESGLPAGKYQQVRLTASSAYGVGMDGARIAIALPAKELKVVKGFKVEAGKETQLVLDVDLEKSLKEGKDGWELKPVIGKLYSALKEKGAKPSAGSVAAVDLRDDAAT
ncbi:MAG TPA: DUF4382 domain-containing protein [Candidatus Thermoplasmatota archaeon]|nr:DUF4382 domain-containing protein [Candidatus Thermoplasmatota archaeon]